MHFKQACNSLIKSRVVHNNRHLYCYYKTCLELQTTQVCIPKQQICRKMFYLNSHNLKLLCYFFNHELKSDCSISVVKCTICVVFITKDATTNFRFSVLRYNLWRISVMLNMYYVWKMKSTNISVYETLFIQFPSFYL